MSSDTVAHMLNEAIERSGLTDQEVAERIGLEAGNMITMMRQGLIKVPLQRLASLVTVLSFDENTFFRVATQEYGDGIFTVTVDPENPENPRVAFALRLLYHLGAVQGSDVWPPLEKALEGILELIKLTEAAKR